MGGTWVGVWNTLVFGYGIVGKVAGMEIEMALPVSLTLYRWEF
jgi:hypothetical protein